VIQRFVVDVIQPRALVNTVACDCVSPVSAVAIAILATIWFAGAATVLGCGMVRWRRVAAIVRRALPITQGRDLHILRRLERVLGVRRPIALVSCDAPLEPGLFGILHPVLVWLQPVASRLDDQQAEVILAHELLNAIRNDNLTAILHILVEAVFWFTRSCGGSAHVSSTSGSRRATKM
jgi:beta-lactamase regulating signal transducer with metallopeptidase domain